MTKKQRIQVIDQLIKKMKKEEDASVELMGLRINIYRKYKAVKDPFLLLILKESSKGTYLNKKGVICCALEDVKALKNHPKL